MMNMAILTDKKAYFDALVTKLNGMPVHFHWFERVNQFLSYKNFDAWQIVWIVGKSMDWVEETLVILNEKQITIPLVCTTPFLKQDQRQLLWQLNVKEIIPWPVHRVEMEHIIRSYKKFMNDSQEEEQYVFNTSLEIINGVDLLRLFTKATCTGVLYFHWAERKGRIEFKKGQIVNAQYRQMDPLSAVLILTWWKHGLAFFKDDQFVSKRSIMLTNEQILTECAEYQKEYEKLLAEFKAVNDPYYPHPQLNYEDFGPNERKILREMRKGKSIRTIAEAYEGDVNFILKKLKNWADQQFIVPEKAYRQIKLRIEEEESSSAIKRMMQKLFGKKSTELPEVAPQETQRETKPLWEHRFVKKEVLTEFKNRLEDMS